MSSTRDIPRTDSGPLTDTDPRTITDFSDFFGTMAEEAKEYVVTERAYITLLLTKRAAQVSHALVGVVVAAIILAIAILFASIALATVVGRATGDPAIGYLAVAGLYAIVLLVFRALWKSGAGDRFKVNIINLLHGH